MHQVLLCNESEFFRGCLQTQFSEASTAEVPLPNDDTVVVERFLQWLYSGQYDARADDLVDGRDYAFGDKYCSDKYCNAIVDAHRVVDKAKSLRFTLRGVQGLYDAGLRGKSFAEYALKSWVYRLQTANRQSVSTALIRNIETTEVTPELSTDILLRIVEFRKAPWDIPSCWEGCHFHVGEHCCSAKVEK